MQILPREQSFGGALGAGLGELAGLKLAQLVKRHEQKQERSQFAKTWEPILGQNTANFLSNLNPQERENALQNVSSLLQLNQPPSSREQVSGMQSLSSQEQPEMEQQFGPEQVRQVGRENYLNKLLGQQQQPNLIQKQPKKQLPTPQQPKEQQMAPKVTPDKAKLIENIFKTPQQKAAAQKLEIENKKEARAEHAAALKETKPYVDALKEKEKAAKEANLRLSRMETLIDKGNLPISAIWSSLSKLEHAPFISGLTGPLAELLKGGLKWYSGNAADVEEFEKLSSEFVKNAKQYFGSRITQKEVEMFMQTVPSLMQTDAGKKKLIENIRSLNELAEIEAKAARSIIRENGGRAPVDIEQQVQDKIGNKLDKVANKFITR